MMNYQIVLCDSEQAEILYMDFNFWCNISWCMTVPFVLSFLL